MDARLQIFAGVEIDCHAACVAIGSCMLASSLDRDEREDVNVAAHDHGFVEEVGVIRQSDECRGRLRRCHLEIDHFF